MKTKTKFFSYAGLIIAAMLMIANSCSSGEEKQSLTTDETLQSPVTPENIPDFLTVDGDTVWLKADEMPVFAGGDSALLKFIRDNAVYPKVAKEKGIQGRVIVRFCVKDNGYVDHVSVMKKVSPELDEESVRVVSALPQFQKAGMKNGKPVNVWYMVPVMYSLK